MGDLRRIYHSNHASLAMSIDVLRAIAPNRIRIVDGDRKDIRLPPASVHSSHGPLPRDCCS